MTAKFKQFVVKLDLCHKYSENFLYPHPLFRRLKLEQSTQTDCDICLFPPSKVNRCDINSVDSHRKQSFIAVSRLWVARFACRR